MRRDLCGHAPSRQLHDDLNLRPARATARARPGYLADGLQAAGATEHGFDDLRLRDGIAVADLGCIWDLVGGGGGGGGAGTSRLMAGNSSCARRSANFLDSRNA